MAFCGLFCSPGTHFPSPAYLPVEKSKLRKRFSNCDIVACILWAFGSHWDQMMQLSLYVCDLNTVCDIKKKQTNLYLKCIVWWT